MMKRLGLSLLLGAFLAAASSASAQEKAEPKGKAKASAGKEEMIAKIQKYREEGEQKIRDNKFTRKEISLLRDDVNEQIKQKWGKMDVYYEGGKVVRIQLYPRKGVSERTEEFYLIYNKLVFAFIQDKGPKHEGTDTGEPGKELYFHNGKLIKFEDRSGEKEENVEQEKRMFETRLPYEISELLEILKKG